MRITILEKTSKPNHSKSTIFVVNNDYPAHTVRGRVPINPFTFNSTGLVNQIDFSFGELDTESSCPITWKNEFYFFGGESSYHNKFNYVNKIINCELKNIGLLPFSFRAGGCTNVADEKLYLCFYSPALIDRKQCVEANSPTGCYKAIHESYFEHNGYSIASSDGKNVKFFSFIIYSSRYVGFMGKRCNEPANK